MGWPSGCFLRYSPKKLNRLTFPNKTSKLHCIRWTSEQAPPSLIDDTSICHQRLQAVGRRATTARTSGPSPRSSGSGVTSVLATST